MMFNKRAQVKNKILNYFFLNESGRIYINELARLIKADPKNVYRILLVLQEEGLLLSEFKGKERFFYSNKRNPLYKGCRDIFLKTVGLEAILKGKIKDIPGIVEAYIFGSYANKGYNMQSDIDVLLVGRHKTLDAQKIIFKVQKDVAREINVVNITPAELAKKKSAKDQFIQSIFDHKTIRLV